MYYRIKDDIAVRSWMFIPGAYYRIKELPAHPLSDGQMDMIALCDGYNDLSYPAGSEEDKILSSLIEDGVIEACSRGEEPSEWSRYRAVPHRHFPKMNFMMTGKCNYNCLHCFNAADLSPLMSEWKYEDCLKLLDQATEAGIHAITITGGEPMAHPHFMDIMKAIHKRNMYVEELNTNGFFITGEVLREFKSFGCEPLIKISFDGTGFHDWIRDHRGAEEETLSAIRLCKDYGFRVMVQMQVNKKNLEAIRPSALMLNDMGVDELRLIRTTEVIRWIEHAGDACIPLEEYYEILPRMARDIYDELRLLPIEKRHLKKLIIWQLLTVDLINGEYSIYPVRYPEGTYRDTYAVCQGNRGMIAVTSGGEMVPCMQMSGFMMEHNIHLGNVYDTPLRELLSDGAYLKMITKNLYQLRQINETCDKCRYYKYCGGGCRALALLYSKLKNDPWSVDPAKCMFFNGGWYEKTAETMGDMKNLSVMEAD